MTAINSNSFELKDFEVHAPPRELREGGGIGGGDSHRLTHCPSSESADSMFLYQHGKQDSYSSGYSGMSGSHSSGAGLYDATSGGDYGHDNMSGYLNDYSDIGSCIQRVARHKTLRPSAADSDVITTTNDTDTTISVVTQSSSLLESEDFVYLEKCDKLPELTSSLPWNENEVLLTLKSGRPKHMSGHITVEMMQRVSFLLQRPLIRIAKEAQTLSSGRLNICTKHEIEAAFKAVLSRDLARSCQRACAKAVTLYSMSGDTLKQSKASRCGLHLSVGKFHRWMLAAQVSTRVHEFGAIYLTACVENLLEEIVLRALAHEQLGEYVPCVYEYLY